MLSVNGEEFHFSVSNLDSFYFFFSSLTGLAGTSRVMMDRMNKRGNPYLRLYPKAKSIQFFNVSYNVAAAAKSLQSCSTLCDPIDGSHQAPPSLGFSRQEHWSGLPFPSPMHESEK